MSETWVRVGRGAVIVVGVIVAAISYSHIRDLALAYGGNWLTAPLLPLGIDGAVAAMTVFMHQAQGAALWLSRFGLLVAIGMTVAFNTAYGAAFGVTGAVVWSSPAVLLVICIEVSVLTVRRSPVVESDTVTAVTPDPLPVAEPVTVSEKKPRFVFAPDTAKPLTVAQQAEQAGVSERTMYRRLAMANGNGKAHG